MNKAGAPEGTLQYCINFQHSNKSACNLSLKSIKAKCKMLNSFYTVYFSKLCFVWGFVSLCDWVFKFLYFGVFLLCNIMVFLSLLTNTFKSQRLKIKFFRWIKNNESFKFISFLVAI